MSESVKTLSLGRSQGESPANKGKADASEDEPREPKRHKISPRATLDALSGLRIGRERVMIPESLDAKARGASASVQIAILLPPNEEHPGHSSTQGHFVALKQFRLDDDKGDKAGLADYWSRTREYIERDLKAVDEAVLLQAVSERHLSEGRLGEALQYIQAFRRAVRLTEGEPAAITFQDMLDRCRRSPSTVDTVPEEEAARSWNSALDLFAGQLYLEAERHIIDAALLYKVLGFDTQVLECVQFLDMLQAATATPSQNPTEEARYNQDLPKRLLMRSEELKDPKYENRENPAEMVWFVA
ncbi:hypothetical protein FRC04_007996 [Tulasnella sp. 424]|nr:hypothetical protein FRC04_007996 [Tulasnella sp. 424]